MQIRIIPRSYVQLHSYILTMDQRIDGVADDRLPFSPKHLEKYRSEKVLFFERLADYRKHLVPQLAAGKKAKEASAELRMFISHFFQSLSNAIARKVVKPTDLILFGLDGKKGTVPKLSREGDLLWWAEQIKRGEASRIAKGGVPVAFPSAAEVEVVAEKCGEAMRQHGDARLKAAEKLREVKKAFPTMRDAIMDLYDELEYRNNDYEPAHVREILRGYGMQYRTVTTYAFKKTIQLAAGETLAVSEFALAKDHHISLKLKAKGKGSVLVCREEGGCPAENAVVLKKGKALKITLKELMGKGNFLVLVNGGGEEVAVDVKVRD